MLGTGGDFVITFRIAYFIAAAYGDAMTTPRAATVKTCGYPGCDRETAPPEPGAGRPPEYCDDQQHNRAAAWRERRRQGASSTSSVDEARPVDAARQRATEIRGQVTGMAELLGQQLGTFLEELRTLADPEAAEAQIEAVTSEAAERVAVAAAAAIRAEQAQRAAERLQAEADAAAAEATALAEDLQESLEQQRALMAEREQLHAAAVGDLKEGLRVAGDEQARLQLQLEQVRQDLAVNVGRLSETERERDDAAARADKAAAGRADAERQASAAAERASAAVARTETAEATIMGLRAELQAASQQREQLLAQHSDLRASLATSAAELAAARADVEREQAFAGQRVEDVRSVADEQITALRTELQEARAEAQLQRTRADVAERQLPSAPNTAKPGRRRAAQAEAPDS